MLALWAKPKEGGVNAVDLKTGALFKSIVQILQQAVINLMRHTAYAADQVMVVYSADLIDHLPTPDMRGEHQTHLGEKAQRSINGCYCQSGYGLPGALVNFCWE